MNKEIANKLSNLISQIVLTVDENKETTDKNINQLDLYIKQISENSNTKFAEISSTFQKEIKTIQKSIEKIKVKNGKDGKTPVKGIDYLTDTDIQDLIAKVIASLPKQSKEKVEIDTDLIVSLVLSKIVLQKGDKGDKGEKGESISKEELNLLEEKLIERVKKEVPAPTIVNRYHSTEFIRLEDTPESYEGQAGKIPKVNATETGLEFSEDAGGAETFLELTDTPSSYSGQGGKGVRVKGAEDGLEFYTTTDSDEKVKVSANDTTAGYLNGKLVAGTGITLTENNDGANETLTIDSTQYTDEQAQDAVGNILTDTATIDFTYDDTTPTITADVKDNSITFAKMQDITTNKLIGRYTSGNGDPEEVGVDGGLEFNGTNIRRSALTGDVEANAGSANTTIANNAVTNAKLADMATSTIKGRATAGTGDPEDLTATQVRTILNVEDGAEVNTIDTVSDTAEIDLTITGRDLTASIVAGSIDETKLDTSVNASLDLADSALQSSDIGVSVQAHSTVLDNTTASFTTADETKLDYITVTQAVNLDQMETDIAALANGMVYKGDWDASVGTFPGSGSAQAGWFYYVSVAGTVDGVSFAIGDNIVATVDNASTTVYASNWSKHDQTDAVSSVNGNVGAVVLDADSIAETASRIWFTSAEETKLAGIETGAEVNTIDTVSDSSEIDFTITARDLTATLKAGSIDETKLDASVNASLDLADTSLQPANISDTAYDSTSWNGVTTIAPSKNAVRDKIDSMDTTIAGKQDTLVSGTNIKTINSTSLLGSGDIAITPNATHTGEVTGATALTLDKTAISNRTDTVITASDYIIFGDATDSDNLKKDTVQGILDLATGVTDGDKGDITVSGSGATWTVDNDAITYAKIQNVSATDRLLGRDTAGAGDIEELTVSGGLEFTGTGIQRSALTGEVTASAGSNTTVLDKTAVSSKLSVTPQSDDYLLIGDTSDSDNLKKTTISNVLNLAGQIPIGGVIDWAGTTLPTGYLYCDGSVISRTTYADLFTAIGTTFGAGDGSTTFALPDLRGRVSAGKDNMDNIAGTGGGDAGRLTSTSKAGVDGDTLGASGGVQEHLLLHEESGVPAHTHPYYDRYNINDNIFANGTVNRKNTLSGLNTTTSANTAADATEAHTNVQPTLVLNKIIRFGI